MGEEELARLQALADGATPGPWTATRCEDSESRCDGIHHGAFEWDEVVTTDSGNYGLDWPTAQFIAAARTAVPELVAEVRRQRDALRRIGMRMQRRNADHPASVNEVLSEVRDALGVEEFTRLPRPFGD